MVGRTRAERKQVRGAAVNAAAIISKSADRQETIREGYRATELIGIHKAKVRSCAGERTAMGKLGCESQVLVGRARLERKQVRGASCTAAGIISSCAHRQQTLFDSDRATESIEIHEAKARSWAGERTAMGKLGCEVRFW